jgi:hypothetical protein
VRREKNKVNEKEKSRKSIDGAAPEGEEEERGAAVEGTEQEERKRKGSEPDRTGSIGKETMEERKREREKKMGEKEEDKTKKMKGSGKENEGNPPARRERRLCQSAALFMEDEYVTDFGEFDEFWDGWSTVEKFRWDHGKYRRTEPERRGKDRRQEHKGGEKEREEEKEKEEEKQKRGGKQTQQKRSKKKGSKREDKGDREWCPEEIEHNKRRNATGEGEKEREEEKTKDDEKEKLRRVFDHLQVEQEGTFCTTSVSSPTPQVLPEASQPHQTKFFVPSGMRSVMATGKSHKKQPKVSLPKKTRQTQTCWFHFAGITQFAPPCLGVRSEVLDDYDTLGRIVAEIVPGIKRLVREEILRIQAERIR